MNAPFPPHLRPHGRLSDSQIDQIVDRYLADEIQRENALDAYLEPNLERFVAQLNRKRRRALLRRFLPIATISWLGHIRWRRVRPAVPDAASSDVMIESGTQVDAATRRQSRWARSARIIAILALLKGVGVYAVEPVLGPVIGALPSILADRAQAALRCGDAVLLRDGAGRAVGAVPVNPSDACNEFHLTAPFDDAIAQRIAEGVGVLEGRWQRSPLTLFGQDLVGLGRGAGFEFERWVRGLSREQALASWLSGTRPTVLPPRGSGPMLSVFEALIGQPGRVGDPFDKVRNVYASMVFVARGPGTDTVSRARFLAERMTVIHGVGRPLAGALAAEALFGRPPANLGEICLFAAASTFHLYQNLPVYGDHVVRRLERARARARVCADRLAEDDAERDEAREVIDRFELPAGMLPILPAGSATVVRDALVAAGISQAQADLRLSIDFSAQVASHRPVLDVLDRLSGRLSSELCFAGSCQTRADYLVAVAEIDGDDLPLRVAFTNRHRSLLGPFEPRQGASPTPLPPAFGLGSQHKSLLALIAAHHGETRLCNRVFGPITNTSGPAPVESCDGRDEGWVGTREALGRSMNLPWVDIARRRASEMSLLEAGLGFMGDPAGPGGAALGVGRRAPPERFLAYFAALARAAAGHRPSTNGLMVFDGYPAHAVDLEGLGYAADVVREAAMLFSAPFEANGTLRHLPAQLRPLGCTAELGKTGTTEIDGGGRARSRTATVVVSCGTRQFVVFASVESFNAQQPLGDITAREIGELIAAALSGLSNPER
jgi:hypothetical protein